MALFGCGWILFLFHDFRISQCLNVFIYIKCTGLTILYYNAHSGKTKLQPYGNGVWNHRTTEDCIVFVWISGIMYINIVPVYTNQWSFSRLFGCSAAHCCCPSLPCIHIGNGFDLVYYVLVFVLITSIHMFFGSIQILKRSVCRQRLHWTDRIVIICYPNEKPKEKKNNKKRHLRNDKNRDNSFQYIEQ